MCRQTTYNLARGLSYSVFSLRTEVAATQVIPIVFQSEKVTRVQLSRHCGGKDILLTNYVGIISQTRPTVMPKVDRRHMRTVG